MGKHTKFGSSDDEGETETYVVSFEVNEKIIFQQCSKTPKRREKGEEEGKTRQKSFSTQGTREIS